MQADPLHIDSIIVDGHCDTLGAVEQGVRSLGERSEKGHIDLPRLLDGGVTAQIFACFVPVSEYRRGATRHALARVDAFLEALEAYPEELVLATSSADIRRAKGEGKVAGILGLEGAESLEGSLAVLRSFYRLGVRNLGLTWNHRNAVADGVMEGPKAAGLSGFGVQVIEECNRLGMMIDVSHLAPAGISDVLETSQHPIVASHSNARACFDHVRNLTDSQIEGIVANGGLIGVTFVNAFLHHPMAEASIEHVLDQIDYLVSVAGPDHIMIGSDFDGCTPPKDLPDVTYYPNLTTGMLARGHDEITIRKILGLNFLRVFEAVTGG
ncbi:MAG: dipeptidase [Chloroflexota bacterium]|nr:dipeptidase [Chloroflexota bacterium]